MLNCATLPPSLCSIIHFKDQRWLELVKGLGLSYTGPPNCPISRLRLPPPVNAINQVNSDDVEQTLAATNSGKKPRCCQNHSFLLFLSASFPQLLQL